MTKVTEYKFNGKNYIECKNYYYTDKFEVVNKFPQGYIIWLVGDYPKLGYLALAKPKDSTHIIRKDLKCIYVGEVLHKKINKLCHNGKKIDFVNFDEVCEELRKEIS